MLVVWFGFNGPLRQYFSLYRTVPKRERERERGRRKIKSKRKKHTKKHPHLLQAQYALILLLSKILGRPGTECLPSTIAHPDHPLGERPNTIRGNLDDIVFGFLESSINTKCLINNRALIQNTYLPYVGYKVTLGQFIRV